MSRLGASGELHEMIAPERSLPSFYPRYGLRLATNKRPWGWQDLGVSCVREGGFLQAAGTMNICTSSKGKAKWLPLWGHMYEGPSAGLLVAIGVSAQVPRRSSHCRPVGKLGVQGGFLGGRAVRPGLPGLPGQLSGNRI